MTRALIRKIPGVLISGSVIKKLVASRKILGNLKPPVVEVGNGSVTPEALFPVE